MANYRDIKGFQVQSLSSDPVLNAGSWAAGGNLNTGRQYVGGAGSATAALTFGGTTTPPVVYKNVVESYNGSAWTEVGDLNTARSSFASAGSSTAALAAGGRISAPADTDASEEWNGTSLTEGNEMNTKRYAHNNRGVGTQTADLAAGGNDRDSTYTALVEDYD